MTQNKKEEPYIPAQERARVYQELYNQIWAKLEEILEKDKQFIKTALPSLTEEPTAAVEVFEWRITPVVSDPPRKGCIVTMDRDGQILFKEFI